MKHSYVIPLRFSPLSYILARGRAVWKLAWLITKRSRVQIPLPQFEQVMKLKVQGNFNYPRWFGTYRSCNKIAGSIHSLAFESACQRTRISHEQTEMEHRQARQFILSLLYRLLFNTTCKELKINTARRNAKDAHSKFSIWKKFSSIGRAYG